MDPGFRRRFMLLPVLLCIIFMLTSCGDSSGGQQTASSSGDTASSSGDTASAPHATRDNTPVVLNGTADGDVTYGNESVTIDASHTEEGYIMVCYTGDNQKVKLQITGTDNVIYTYNLHGGYETFPLTAGSGSYTVGIFENMGGTSYSTLYTQAIDVEIANEYGAYLYANQYVDFTSDSDVVAEAQELAATASDDLEVVENVYNYMITNFTYDYDKAATVVSGYLPDVEAVFAAKKGICFDYAAVMATMLRCERIPTRLEVGYVGDVYHAWISTYIEDQGWINGIIEFDGDSWELMDPTFASTSSSPKDFLAETDEYVTKYVY